MAIPLAARGDFIQADTLRRDHFDFHRHSRETAPFLTRVAKEGVHFNNSISQASWTKVSTSSMMTSLIRDDGVRMISDACRRRCQRWPRYKAAGYATLSCRRSHLPVSIRTCIRASRSSTRTAPLPQSGRRFRARALREYIDRLVPRFGRHREVPFLVYLQVFDPHFPFQPYGPYNTKFGDPARTEQHRKEEAAVTKLIEDPVMRGRRLPTRER